MGDFQMGVVLGVEDGLPAEDQGGVRLSNAWTVVAEATGTWTLV